ncbi:hypothetical protein PYCCODRAFT_1430664 [Trametes coccinea BRFM310]|uniref:Uncharacterized protein n=1 Tax=Trametes coccinea (strain BRFM310) TaxID=1353009 RepID=A0A1Y2J275_TRAC3|nr:hypothetical protein PYCCODRAFT_1430664 [Trametes coccinea BRFM310]
MKLSLFASLAASLALVASRAVSIRDASSDPAHGQIVEPVAGAHIAPGQAFDFSYVASADYCRSTYAYSVWLVTDAPTSLVPSDVFAAGHFFGRYDFPNYPAVPYPKNPAPAQLTMPDFSKAPAGWAGAQSASNKTVQLAVLEEWAGCDTDAPLGYTFSLTSVPVVYNATSA